MSKSLGISQQAGVVVRGPYESFVKVTSDQGKDVLWVFHVCDVMIDGTLINEVPIKELKLI